MQSRVVLASCCVSGAARVRAARRDPGARAPSRLPTREEAGAAEGAARAAGQPFARVHGHVVSGERGPPAGICSRPSRDGSTATRRASSSSAPERTSGAAMGVWDKERRTAAEVVALTGPAEKVTHPVMIDAPVSGTRSRMSHGRRRRARRRAGTQGTTSTKIALSYIVQMERGLQDPITLRV